MPIEYFETEPTKKQPPESLLDRVVETTEHHEHQVTCEEILNQLKEDPICNWNSRVYNYDLQEYKLGLERRQWGQGLYVKATTPTMTVIGHASQIELRLTYEPAGNSRTLVTITAFAQGQDHTEECREMIVDCLDTIGETVEQITRQARVTRVTSRRPTVSYRTSIVIRAGGAIAVLFLLLFISGAFNSPTPATAPQATPTPTPTVQKAEPHKAARGRRR